MAKSKSNKVAGMPAGAPPRVELRRIVIAGKEYPCRITMGAMLRFKRAIGHDVSKLDSGKIEELLTFVHCCIASACNVDRIEFGLTVEEMADNIEPDALNAFYDAISSPVAGETDPEKKTVAPA